MGLLSAVGVRADPLLNHNFLVSLTDSSSTLAFLGSPAASAILDIAVGGFSECTGLEMSMQPEEYKEGGRNDAVRKFPTEGRYVPQLLAAYEKVCESYPMGVKPLADLYVELGPALVRHYKEEDSPFIDKIRQQAEKFFDGQGLTKHAQTFQARMVQAGARSR